MGLRRTVWGPEGLCGAQRHYLGPPRHCVGSRGEEGRNTHPALDPAIEGAVSGERRGQIHLTDSTGVRQSLASDAAQIEAWCWPVPCIHCTVPDNQSLMPLYHYAPLHP